MKKIFFFILLFLFLVQPANAAQTSWFSPSTVGTGNQWNNPSNAFSTDSLYADSGVNSSAVYLKLTNYGINLPFGAEITSFDFSVVASRATGTPSVNQILNSILIDSNNSYFGSISAGTCTTNRTITLSSTSLTEYLFSIPVTCFSNANLITRETITSSEFGTLHTKSVNGSTEQRIDSVRIRVNYNYSVPTVLITSATSSPSGQLNYLTLEGTTSTASSAMQCDIGLFERCSKAGFAGWTSQTPVAHIKLDATNTENFTRNLGGGYFSGYNWGGTDTTWKADNVEVPYNPGYFCDYPISFYCTENRNVVVSDNFSQNQSLVATPSGQLNQTTYTEPEPTNPLQWVIWRLKQIFWEFFGFGDVFEEQYFALLKENFETRVPFAYANAVFSLDFSSSPEASTAPTVSIPLIRTEGLGGVLAMEWSAPQVFYDYMVVFKNAIKIFIYLIFVAYLFLLSRRIFQ